MDIVELCTDYLSNGGLFNPELAIHDRVRDLVIDCRSEIEKLRKENKQLREERDKHARLLIEWAERSFDSVTIRTKGGRG